MIRLFPGYADAPLIGLLLQEYLIGSETPRNPMSATRWLHYTHLQTLLDVWRAARFIQHVVALATIPVFAALFSGRKFPERAWELQEMTTRSR